MIDYHKQTDLELTLLLKEGDRLAFTEIYQRYWGILFRHAYKMLRDEDQAADVIQDLFTQLLQKHEGIQFTGSLSGYLYSATRNRILNHFKASKVREAFISTMSSTSVEASRDLTEDLVAQDLARRIEAGIEKLPKKMREIFELSRKQGMSQKEIAAELDTSEANVKKQIGRAIKILRMRLELILISVLIFFS